MFNVAVLKLKDIIKYFVGAIILIMIIVVLTKYFSGFGESSQKLKENINKQTQTITTSISQNTFLSCFNLTLPVAANVNEEYNNIYKEDDVHSDKNIFQEMLKTQISSIKGIEEVEEKSELEMAEKEQNNQPNTTDINTANTNTADTPPSTRYRGCTNRRTNTSHYPKSYIRKF